MSEEKKKKTVLVTGFGPFGVHTVNASWVAVQELAKKSIPGVIIVIREIPVVYETVKKQVPQLWNDVNPQLVIHVGVSKEANAITLEQQAHNDGYKRLDVLKTCPSNNCCVEGADECLVSSIDMEKVCSDVNGSGLKVKAVVSHDPGRYLCDFSYFVSLHIDRSKSAFIHVPPLGKPYTELELADGLEQVILSMLGQI
ncbi:pyroglutamyl-peptidase 1-like [Mytilus californianus]|uniref:pyroglutamyl-peptidase 1-like n=1 Tax=Mytilus californianus TaxID=6549 RepID=UPI0022464CB7|nr:pyroglutamyl-peptidase 1-like [Mytilus californianus]